jgi:ADP-dependent NAD(P)H-hydrate dehydratase / NAD(P)H-hydrate epimerase
MTNIDIAVAKSLLRERPADAHKGTFGHLFVLAGSRGFTGAAKLVCEAAMRSGVGLVTLGVPNPLADCIASALTETMTLPLAATIAESFTKDALEPALAFARDKQAVALGPGLSQHPSTQAFVLAFVKRCPVPMLIDADGLNALASSPDALCDISAPRVLTPHPGEMARLLKKTTADVQRDRPAAASEATRRFQCVVVLKGHRTIIATPGGELFENTTGNAGLAKGGTGDVLAGLIGGLLAQGMSPRDAAILGVYVHGLAGDYAAAAKTQRGMVAMDVVHALHEAWRHLEAGACP